MRCNYNGIKLNIITRPPPPPSTENYIVIGNEQKTGNILNIHLDFIAR